MGNFSYISENRGEQILNPWNEETLCELQLIFNGKVIEKLRGVYNGYGAVILEKEFKHLIIKEDEWIDITQETANKSISMSGDTWKSFTWNEIVNIHFGNSSDGLAAWHLDNINQAVPEATNKSQDDENQGDIFQEDEEEDEEDEYHEDDNYFSRN